MTAAPPPARPQRSITRTALLLLPAQVIFRGGEALMPLLLSAWFGRSEDTDVFNLVAAIIVFASSLLASAFQDSAFVPTLTEVELRAPAELPKVAGAILGHALLIGAALTLLTAGASLAGLRAAYQGRDFLLAAELMAPFAGYMFALVVRSYFVGLLNMHGRFFAHPIASGTGVLVTLGLVFGAKDSLGVVAIPLGQLAGELVAIAVLCFITFRVAGLRLVLSLARTEPVVRFAKLVAQEVTGSTITRINPIVDQATCAFAAVVGGGTVLRYTNDVASLPTSLLQATVLSVLLSQLSRQAAAKATSDVRHTVTRTLLVSSAILAALCLLLYFFQRPVLELLFLHGQMDGSGIALMETILPFSLLGVVPFGALLILAKAHVALQNTRIMVWMGALNAVLNLVFNVVFVLWMGLPGIALSTSAMHLVIAAVFWVKFKQRLAESDQRSAVRGQPLPKPTVDG